LFKIFISHYSENLFTLGCFVFAHKTAQSGSVRFFVPCFDKHGYKCFTPTAWRNK